MRQEDGRQSNFELGRGGFTLIEVLMASALISGLALVMSDLIVTGNEAAAYFDDRLDQQEFRKEVSSLLSDPVACAKTFAKTAISKTSSAPELKDKSGKPRFVAGSSDPVIAASRVRFDKLEVVNVNVPATPGSSGEVEIRVYTSRASNSGLKSFKFFPVKLFVQKIPSGHTIASCSPTGSSDEAIESACIFLDGIYKNGTIRTATVEESAGKSYMCYPDYLACPNPKMKRTFHYCHLANEFVTELKCDKRLWTTVSKTLSGTKEVKESKTVVYECFGG